MAGKGIKVTKTPDGIVDGSKVKFYHLDEQGLHPESPKDPIVESVIAKMRIRSQAGIKEYGTTLADNPMKLIEWLNEAQAEAMDLALYLERIKQELSESKDL